MNIYIASQLQDRAHQLSCNSKQFAIITNQFSLIVSFGEQGPVSKKILRCKF